ncbi:MAG: hypothetical protein IKW81_02490, partial [Pseudobutyrivibrio sp.]|nr:hypothetical protein [Pseudobutyrivibrio sp.]
MSAIFGAIDFSGKEVSRALGENFLANYQKYKIDRMEQISEGNLFMGCGIQYFNHEAEREQLPYYDAERNIFFTADCVIDNREELIETLGLENNVPDGRIILEAYYKWGKGCLQKLRGPFSFVVYERETGKVFMAVDHFAQRCLMYHLRDGVLYFSTLLFPMIDSLGLKFFENERWLLDSISVRGAIMVSEPKETSVQDVYKVVAGNYIEFYLKEDNKIYKNEVRYFNPERDVKTDYTITQEQSEKMIRSVMSKNISQIIREDVEIASQLSSGLDSSTVACTAAGQLAARGRTLYTYTSVPDKDANLKNKGYFVTDEREGVEKICREYPNIEPTFVDTKGRNILKEIDDILDCWEMPCKSQQNAIWVDEISKLASKRGCRILLCGATGNTTLSAGDNACAFAYYAKRLRFIKA